MHAWPKKAAGITFTRRVTLNFYDVGGHEKIRKIWPNYYADSYACVFVVDGSSPARWKDAKTVLHEMVLHPLMQSKPLLILVNRIQATALDQVKDALDLQGLLRSSQKGGLSSVRNGGLLLCLEFELEQGMQGLQEGLDWLIGAIEINKAKLVARVALDVKEQERVWKEEQEAKKAARAASGPGSKDTAAETTVKSSKIYPE
ncbi:ADP-ribosylation factor-like protein 13B [Kappamyces sp. JEL0680]|nr:ADP-ribosylation factor-like protein 13B [Kappamyces sp. JEL0680]